MLVSGLHRDVYDHSHLLPFWLPFPPVSIKIAIAPSCAIVSATSVGALCVADPLRLAT
jgi:hypothetical protein